MGTIDALGKLENSDNAFLDMYFARIKCLTIKTLFIQRKGKKIASQHESKQQSEVNGKLSGEFHFAAAFSRLRPGQVRLLAVNRKHLR